MPKLYLINEKTGQRFDVVSFNKATQELTLKGVHFDFVEKFDKDKFLKWGYVMKQEQNGD